MSGFATTLAADSFVVIGGNGPSLARLAPDRVLAGDVIFRINSFFLETDYHLGRRVDLALIAGDPRVVPFVLETMRRAQGQYELRRWAATKPRVARIARGSLDLPEERLRQTPAAAAELDRLMAEYQAEPTSGIQALFLAHAMGARRIGLAGIDLYAAPTRYAFEPGPRMRALMGRDLATRPYDRRLHHPDLDKAAISWLSEQADVSLFRLSEDSPLAEFLDLAPPREGMAPERPVKPPITDWAGWAKGWYPARALWAMRKVRSAQMRLMRRLRG